MISADNWKRTLREMSSYVEDMSFDDINFKELEDRVNVINHLKSKYGNTTTKKVGRCKQAKCSCYRLFAETIDTKNHHRHQAKPNEGNAGQKPFFSVQGI